MIDRSQGLRFTSKGVFNDDLGWLMSAVLKRQMRRRPRFFIAFVVSTAKRAP